MNFELVFPAFASIGAGIIAAIVAVRRASAGGAEVDLDTTLRDLEERVEHAVAQLRDFDSQRAKMEDAFYAEHRAALEARATEALRARDALLAKRAEPKAATPRKAASRQPAEVSPTMSYLASRPALRGALWGGGIVAVLAVLLGSLLVDSTPRTSNGMTGPMTGGPARSDEPAQGVATSRGGAESDVQAMIAALEKNPDDLPTLLQLVRRLLRTQMFDEAQQLVARALALAPDNPEAQTYAAVLESARGKTDVALDKLGAIVKQHPKVADGWFFRGMLAMQAGKQDIMRESFEGYLANAPEGPQRERVRAMLQAQQQP